MYYLLFALFYLLSLLPLKCLYVISRCAKNIVFNILKYRKDVVQKNLANAFPAKSLDEISRIQNQFEQSFCDQWIEVIKSISMSEKELRKMIIADWSQIENWYNQGRNVHIFLGHQFNWELANVLCQLNTSGQFYGIYLPLTSKPFNRLMTFIRTRTGSQLINAQELYSGVKLLKKENHILGVIADQSSGHIASSAWYSFLHRPCPFNTVPEKTARVMDAVVLFASMHQIKRGRYQLTFELITDNIKIEEKGTIIDKYVSLLEKSIESQPFNWLWSHKRWKRSLPENIQVRQN